MADYNLDNYSNYDPNKGYTKNIYNPDKPLFAKALNESFDMVDNSIANMGNTLMRDGDIIEGMAFTVKDQSSSSTGKTVTIEAGKVYLNGKVRTFEPKTIEFNPKGDFTVYVKLEREIVTPREDPALLDDTTYANSYLSESHNALKETVNITSNGENAVEIYTFKDGVILTSNSNPEMSKLNDILAKRTYEESGSYRVEGLDLYTEKHPTNENKLQLVVDKGIAYVQGYRNELMSSRRIDLDKALDSRTVQNEPFYYNSTTRKGKVGNNPVANIQRVSGQVQVTKEVKSRGVTQDSGDTLANGSVSEITKVYTDSKTYVQGTDYVLVNGNTVSWSPSGSEPASGSSYYVDYRYNKAMVKDRDYKVVVEGSGDSKTWWIDFNGMTGSKPVVNTQVLIDYTYYLARKDVVVMDKDGNITIKKGEPDSINNVVEPIHADPFTLPLGTVLVLPNSTSSICVKSALNRLSMADLQKMKSRIDTIEYNQALTALDDEIFSSENREQLRGVFSDGFISTNKYDSTHPDAKIGFSFEDAEITLPISKETVKKPNISSTNPFAHSWGRLITAPFTEVKSISQPLASDSLNVNPYNSYNKMGVLKLDPSEDSWINTEKVTVTDDVDPATINVRRWWGSHRNESWVDDQIDAVSNIKLDGSATWGGDSSLDSKVNGSYTRENAMTGTRMSSGGQRTLESAIMEMRQIRVNFEAQNLRPNEDNLTLSFDGVMAPITPASGFVKGTKTGSIRSNSSGLAKGSFMIPAGIRTGTREVLLENANNTAVTSFTSIGTQRRVEDVILRQRVSITLVDPLAQSFSFTTDKVLSSVGLYFASKSSVDNVIIQIRGISEGGMPNKTIYGETVLTPSQVKISANGTAETKVSFEDPLVMTAGKEYAVVAITDSDQYTMWIATRGEEDLNGKGTVTSNPYIQGVLYSSSNASAWTVHQDSDLTFNIYTANFNESAEIQFDTVTDVSAESLVLMSTYLTPQNTGALFEAKVVFDSEPQNTTVDSKAWTPIAEYEEIDFNEKARAVKLRAIFQTNQNMSPILSLDSTLLTSFLSALNGSYIGRTMDMTGVPYNRARISFETFEPAGTNVKFRYKFGKEDGWKDLKSTPKVTQVSNEFTRYEFDELVAESGTTEDTFKVRLDLSSNSNVFIRPRAKRLMVALRNE